MTQDQARDVRLSRRHFLAGGIGVAAFAPLLASCTTGATVGSQEANTGVKLPTYIRYQGLNPDIAGTGTIPDVYFNYPSSPKKLFSKPPGDGGDVSALVQTYAPVPPAEPDNQYWQFLNKQSGVDWKLTITPAVDFPSKFATGAAGDDLGDVYTVNTGFANLPSFLKARAADLTPYLSGDNIKKWPYLANIPTDSWRLAVYNGGIYGIPVPRGVLGSQIPIVRSDIFEQRGVEPGWKSGNEFLKMCTAITDEKSNAWALTYVPFNLLQQIYGGPQGWREKNGKLTFFLELESTMEALSLGQKLVKAGTVHPDAFSVDIIKQKSWFTQGSGALHYDNYQSLGGFVTAGKDIDGFDVAPLVSYDDSGQVAKMFLGSPNNTISAIKKGSSKRITAILDVLNWLAAPFGSQEWLDRKFGIKGRNYTLDGSNPVISSAYAAETQNAGFAIGYLTDSPAPVYFPGVEKVSRAINTQMKAAVPRGILDPTLGLYSAISSTKGAGLNTLITDSVNAILQGRAPVSSIKDTAAKWKSSGGTQIRAEFEKALAQREG